MMNEFNQRLHDLMIAAKSNGHITKSNVSQWLNGSCKPSDKKISILSDIFKCNPNYLLGLTDDSTPPNLEKRASEAKLCDLMSKCFGQDSYRIVGLYLSLNKHGKATAYKRVEELTRLEEYIKKEPAAEEKAK